MSIWSYLKESVVFLIYRHMLIVSLITICSDQLNQMGKIQAQCPVAAGHSGHLCGSHLQADRVGYIIMMVPSFPMAMFLVNNNDAILQIKF